MVRGQITSIVFGLSILTGSGCAHFLEAQAIQQFTEALQEEDLDELKSTTSSGFEQKALRLAESLDDFKILRIPEGKTSIIKVEEKSENEKEIVVEIEDVNNKSKKRKRKLLYKLVRNPDTQKWVVDDIYMKQKRNNLTAAKSVSEQMDLLLTVREFLSAWGDGNREDVINVVTPAFAKVLEALPPTFLARLTEETMGNQSSSLRMRPEAQMDEDVAIVRLPRPKGKLLLSFKLLNDQWKVDDFAVETRSESDLIPSVRKYSRVLLAAATFLEAYGSRDKQALSQVCSKTFYRESLVPADLSLVALPGVDISKDSYEVRMKDRFADFVIETEKEMVKISLISKNDTALTRFQVEDVTLYELDGTQQKRLSALFTSHAMVNIFSEAILTRNLASLRFSSTLDFRNRVWEQLDDATLRVLPLAEIENAQPMILRTSFQGPVTEVTVRQGSNELTYVMLDKSGQILVDDLLVSLPDRPASIKTTLELRLPILNFAAGIRLENIDFLQRSSSQDFNRLVWHQTKQIPSIGAAIPKHLRASLNAIELRRELKQAILTFGDDDWGAKVLLTKEGERYVVDEILLIAGPLESQQTHVKRAMKIELAEGFLNLQRAKARENVPTSAGGFEDISSEIPSFSE